MKSSAPTKLPLNRIKKIMQANKEIGKIQSNTPLVIAQALELFIEDVTRLASQAAIKNQDTKVTPSHIKLVINNAEAEHFHFLKEAVAKVPDLKLTPMPTAVEVNPPSSEDSGAKRKVKAKAKAARR